MMGSYNGFLLMCMISTNHPFRILNFISMEFFIVLEIHSTTLRKIAKVTLWSIVVVFGLGTIGLIVCILACIICCQSTRIFIFTIFFLSTLALPKFLQGWLPSHHGTLFYLCLCTHPIVFFPLHNDFDEWHLQVVEGCKATGASRINGIDIVHENMELGMFEFLCS